jgi:hypothetical protein
MYEVDGQVYYMYEVDGQVYYMYGVRNYCRSDSPRLEELSSV